MKIGILTLPFNNNYGGLLQSYALQTFLKNQGHEVIVINRKPNKLSLVHKLKKLLKYILGREARLSNSNMRHFENEYFQLTEPIYKHKDYSQIDFESFDELIVGSDQVWRFDYTQERKFEYFFDFVKTSKPNLRSFAASFGVDDWNLNSKDTDYIKSLLMRFDDISVREDSGVEICKNILNVESHMDLDPAFLLKDKDYRDLYSPIDFANSKNSGKILVYLLDENKDYLALKNKVSQKFKKELFTVGKTETKSFGIWPKYDYPTVSSWLKGFDDADFVITDSFHGVVFSILFGKNFIAYANKKRGYTRFESLLRFHKMENRLIYSLEELNDALNKV